MFSCLFKKVNIHNSAKLNSISCNRRNDYIAMSGADGFVKVVQIDLNKSKSSEGGNTSPLTFAQNLIIHKKTITLIRWNDCLDKITTCDEEGVIVVWKLSEKNTWETEMINNREVSFVSDLKWSKQGSYICFIYDDGHAIVGTVEGSRCWGNDIKEKLYLIEWSPDASCILFAALNYNVIIFSTSGYQVGEMEIEPSLKSVRLATISWWTNMHSENNSSTLEKHLMFAYKNGLIVLYNDYQDTQPLKFYTDFSEIFQAEWSPSGELIAINGTLKDVVDKRDAIMFYSCTGQWEKALLLPHPVSCFSWDAQGTKLAISSENVVLFALVKQNYKWTYFSDTLVYAFMQESE
jgi:WD repeat-containing protein 35